MILRQAIRNNRCRCCQCTIKKQELELFKEVNYNPDFFMCMRCAVKIKVIVDDLTEEEEE